MESKTAIFSDKFLSGTWFINYFLIIMGSLILAAGFVFFITPYKIVPGGVFGIGIVVHYVTRGVFSFAPEGLPVGLVGLLLNIPLTIIGIKILGPRFGVKTIIGLVLSSVFIDLLSSYWGAKPLVEDDALLSSIFGGVLIGFGLGLIFRTKATSGGSDIVAMVMSKYTKIPVGQTLIYVDSAIVLLGLVVFRDWSLPLYSWIVIFIAGKVIDATIHGLSYDNSVFIISEKHEEIREKILFVLNRGGTVIQGYGLYEEKERKIIFTNLNRRELALLREYIRDIDPGAFISIVNAYEVIGSGFKSLKDYNQV